VRIPLASRLKVDLIMFTVDFIDSAVDVVVWDEGTIIVHGPRCRHSGPSNTEIKIIATST
jgi:hypothetical protein